ncbi:MAG: hypothetical protein AAF587_41945 [Bacteroidota bacterium]
MENKNKSNHRNFELEERTLDFAVLLINLIESIPNYGEAQAGESSKDFIHNMQIALRELRKSNIAMKILPQKAYGDSLMSIAR